MNRKKLDFAVIILQVLYLQLQILMFSFKTRCRYLLSSKFFQNCCMKIVNGFSWQETKMTSVCIYDGGGMVKDVGPGTL